MNKIEKNIKDLLENDKRNSLTNDKGDANKKTKESKNEKKNNQNTAEEIKDSFTEEKIKRRNKQLEADLIRLNRIATNSHNRVLQKERENDEMCRSIRNNYKSISDFAKAQCPVSINYNIIKSEDLEEGPDDNHITLVRKMDNILQGINKTVANFCEIDKYSMETIFYRYSEYVEKEKKEKEKKDKELQSEISFQNKEAEQLINSYKVALENLKESYEEMSVANYAALQLQSELYDIRFEEIIAKHEKEIEKLKADHEREINSIKASLSISKEKPSSLNQDNNQIDSKKNKDIKGFVAAEKESILERVSTPKKQTKFILDDFTKFLKDNGIKFKIDKSAEGIHTIETPFQGEQSHNINRDYILYVDESATLDNLKNILFALLDTNADDDTNITIAEFLQSVHIVYETVSAKLKLNSIFTSFIRRMFTEKWKKANNLNFSSGCLIDIMRKDYTSWVKYKLGTDEEKGVFNNNVYIA